MNPTATVPRAPKEDRTIVTWQNGELPFALALDIQGNFHRGLMLGVLVGVVLGIAATAGGALVVLALRGTIL